MTRAITLAAVLAYFAALTSWGTLLLRRLRLPGQTVLTLHPLGLVVGLAAQVITSNAVAYLIRPPAAFAVAIVLQAISVPALWAKGATPGVAAVSRHARIGASIVGVVVLLTFAARAFTEFQQDNFREHWLDAATILEGNFPVRHPFSPDQPIRYHYGTALLSAELSWATRVSVLWSNQLVKAALVVASMLLVFAFVFEERRSLWPAVFAAAILYFFVGLPELLTQLAHGWHGLSDFAAQAMQYGQHNQFFYYPSAALFVQPLSAGWALALAVVYVLWRCEVTLDLQRATLVAFLLAALALCATPEFIATVGGFALYGACTMLVPHWRHLRPPRPIMLLMLLAATAVAVSVQGGVLTDLWHGSAPGTPPEFAIRWPPGMVVGVDQILVVGSWGWLQNILLATDGLALLLPAAAVATLRRPRPSALLVLAIIIAAAALSHVVSYPSGEFNTNRTLAFAINLSLVLVCVQPPLLERFRRASRWALAGIAIVGCTPALLVDSAAVARAISGVPASGPSYLFWWDDPELRAAARWVGTVMPRGARIATNDPMLLVALSGRFAPNGALDTHGHRHPGLPVDPSRWTSEALAASRIDAICLFQSPFFQAVDVDPVAFAQELRADGRNVALVGQILGPNVGVITSGSPDTIVLGLNAVVRSAPQFSGAVDLTQLGGPESIRRKLLGARTGSAPMAGVGWMYLNRAALQGIFPAGTRNSWRYSEDISDEHLANYAWYRLAGTSPNWIAPPPGEGAGRVRCLSLTLPDQASASQADR